MARDPRPLDATDSRRSFLNWRWLCFAALAALPSLATAFDPGTYRLSVNLTYGTGTGACPPVGSVVQESALIDLQSIGIVNASETFTGQGTDPDNTQVSLSLVFDQASGFQGGSLFATDLDGVITTLTLFTLAGSGGNYNGQVSGDEQDSASNLFCPLTGTYTLTLTGASGATNPETTPSVEATNPITVQRQVTTTTNRIFSRVGAIRRGRATGATPTADGFMLQGGSGLNAGDEFASPIGGWISYGFADFKDTGNFNFDGSRHSGLAGIDITPNDALILGIAAGFDTVDVDTLFNRGNAKTDGYTVAPYLGYAFNDIFSVDVTFGYSGLTTDQYRVDGADRYDASVESTRWFWGSGLNLLHNIGNWYLTGNLGWLWATEDIDGFTETGTGADAATIAAQTIQFGQWRAGGEVAYFLGGFEPYVSASYQYDYLFEDINAGTANAYDNTAVFFTSGLRYYVNNISANVEYTRLMARDNYTENGLNATLRIEF